MKMLLTAVAMLIATPALAQVAPAPSHADHPAHNGHSPTPAVDPHAGHDMPTKTMDCCKKGAEATMACCAKMKAAGKPMPCCDKMKAKSEGAPAAAVDPHAGHNMSSR